MANQKHNRLPPTDRKPIEWESVALIGFEDNGWPAVICTIEPSMFLHVLRGIAIEERKDDLELDEEDDWDEGDEFMEITSFDMEQAEKSLIWALFPVDVAKEIFCSAREEKKKADRRHEQTEPQRPLPGQLTLPISD